MPLWGTSTDADNQPKWLGGVNAEGASGRKTDCFAAPGGWAMRDGQPNSGNDNTSAQVEIIAALSGGHASGLSGALGEANLISVGWDSNTALAHDGTGRLDIYFNCDEALTVTSAAWSADQVISNKLYFDIDNYGPTDMASDGGLKMQYYSGSGTNKLTFRGTIPNTAVAGGLLGHGTYTLATNGSSAMVDGNGTAVTEGDLAGGSAIGGPAGNAEIFANAVTKTGSSIMTEETVAGSSSGSAQCLIGVTTAVS